MPGRQIEGEQMAIAVVEQVGSIQGRKVSLPLLGEGELTRAGAGMDDVDILVTLTIQSGLELVRGVVAADCEVVFGSQCDLAQLVVGEADKQLWFLSARSWMACMGARRLSLKCQTSRSGESGVSEMSGVSGVSGLGEASAAGAPPFFFLCGSWMPKLKAARSSVQRGLRLGLTEKPLGNAGSFARSSSVFLKGPNVKPATR